MMELERGQLLKDHLDAALARATAAEAAVQRVLTVITYYSGDGVHESDCDGSCPVCIADDVTRAIEESN